VKDASELRRLIAIRDPIATSMPASEADLFVVRNLSPASPMRRSTERDTTIAPAHLPSVVSLSASVHYAAAREAT